jgi:glutathione S-transferase
MRQGSRTLGSQSKMKLYDMDKAPNPRRVRMFLAEKGIAVERVEIDIMAGGNLQPDFLAINPRGTLPVLVLDDGTVLDESIAICRYLEAVQPEPNLFGRTPLEIARIESAQRHMELDGMYAIAMIHRNVAPHFVTRSAPGSAGIGTTQIPELAVRGEQLTRRFFADLETTLARQEYVAGDRFSVADITGYICTAFARWVKLAPGDDMPNIARWRTAIAARPSSKA